MQKETSSQKMNTISECINSAVKAGYGRDFFVNEQGLSYSGAAKVYGPEEVVIKNFYRFEGESDPADNSILYLLRTRDGARGTLLDAYGIYSDEMITGFIKAVNEIHKRKPEIKARFSKYLKIGIGAFIAAGAVFGLLYKKRLRHTQGAFAG